MRVFGRTVSVASDQPFYYTTFPLTENPISEGGRWTNGGIFNNGTDSNTNMQTAGKAYGTMVTNTGTQLDSVACLNSGFGPDHEITCTISNSGGFSGFSLELEIHLRCTITATTIGTYEIDCVYGGPGIDLVRWDTNSFQTLRSRVNGEVAFNNGDQVYASVVGTLITCKYKPSGGSFSTLFTYDTSGDATKYSTGNPGIGAWNQTGVVGDQPLFAWSDFRANRL